MRRATRDAVVPSDEIPTYGADQSAKHHMGVNNARLHKAFAHGSCNAQVEHEYRQHVEKGREQHGLARLKNTGRHDRSD